MKTVFKILKKIVLIGLGTPHCSPCSSSTWTARRCSTVWSRSCAAITTAWSAVIR